MLSCEQFKKQLLERGIIWDMFWMSQYCLFVKKIRDVRMSSITLNILS